MKTNRITRVKRKEIIKLRDDNLNHEAIAQKVGCHRNTVGKVLRQERIT